MKIEEKVVEGEGKCVYKPWKTFYFCIPEDHFYEEDAHNFEEKKTTEASQEKRKPGVISSPDRSFIGFKFPNCISCFCSFW